MGIRDSSSAEVVFEATLAGLALYMFVVHSATADKPFIDPHLFSDANFRVGVALIFVVGVILLASVALWASPFLFLGWRWLAIYIGSQWVINLYLGLVFAPNHKGLPTWASGLKLTFLERQVLSSFNVRPGAVADYLYCGLNYQIEHHLFPHICHIHYRNIAPIVEKTAREHGLNYNLKPTFFAALKSHVRRLKELGSPVAAVAA